MLLVEIFSYRSRILNCMKVCRPPFWVYFCSYLSLPHGRFLEGHVSSLEWLLYNGILPVMGGGGFAEEGIN